MQAVALAAEINFWRMVLTMTKDLRYSEPNGRDVYPDIIDHPHWQSPTRPHMSLYDRAAQFSSFDALVGYSDMVKEEERETGVQVKLEEYEKECLNQKLNLISDAIECGRRPVLSITYFVPDERKAGGEYVTVTEEIKKIDPVYHKVVLARTEGVGKLNVEIDIDRIKDIHGELVDYIE